MLKNVLLESIAAINSGVAVERSGDDAFAVMVGDLGSAPLVGGHLAEVAVAPEDARLKDADILISLRGKRNGSSVFKHEVFGGRPVFASLDVAVIRLHEPEPTTALALSFWFNLDSTQRKLAVHRVGSHAFRLPLPALRKFQVPHFHAASAELFVRASLTGQKALKLEQKISERRELLFQEMMTRAAAPFDAG